MNMSRSVVVFCALMPLSLFASDGMWVGTSSNALEVGSNWSPSGVPTGVATFDATVPSVNLFPQVLASDLSSLSLTNFTFASTANFVFTINGPNALNFGGAGCGITGANTNTTILATNSTVGMVLSQLYFSGANATIGDASLYAAVQGTGTMINQPGTHDLGQIVFDGSGGTPGCSIVMNSAVANLHANAYGDITASAMTPVNNVAQILFDGSGGSSGGSGSCAVTIEGNVLLTADVADSIYLGNGSPRMLLSNQGNNSAQILFDGSGGVGNSAGTGQSVVTIGGQAQVLATLTAGNVDSVGVGNNIAQIAFDGSGGTSLVAGGHGSSTVVLKDSALISATCPNYGYPGYYSAGQGNDIAQVLFSGNGGTSYGAAGHGSSTVSITDSAQVFASNTYYLTGSQTEFNDCAQILFDGSGGTGYHAGGSGSINVTINGASQITAENTLLSGYIYTSSAYANDLAQILFDGTPGLNYAGGGSGSCTVTIAENAQISATNGQTIINSDYTNDIGQIVFDGSGGFGYTVSAGSSVVVVIQDNTMLNANNISGGTIQGGYSSNDCGQIIFDGSGGFQYDQEEVGSAKVTLQGAAKLIATNGGSIVSQSTQGSNDLAQILFDGSGGLGGGTTNGSGVCTLFIGDTVSLQATNTGVMGNTTGAGLINNIGQIVIDGSGGANLYAGYGIGHLFATISTTSPISAINETGASITNITSTTNKIGQVIFDGSKGQGSNPGSGELTLIFNDGVAVTASNSGTILVVGAASGVGQILFDGTAGAGSGSCLLQLGGGNTITATNTSTGTVVGDQIAFRNTVIENSGVVQAINQGGSITHGVAFYGPVTQAQGVNVELTGSSLWVDSTLSPSFAIASLSGDASSTAVLDQTCTFDTPLGSSTTFEGDISGTGGMIVTGSGQQIICGDNTYLGATTVDGGTLTLQSSNIPGTLFVANGGTFSGTGVVSGAANIIGTVRPGNSPGTLTFLDGLSVSGTTEIEVSPTQVSLLAVSGGNASISGTLSVLEDPSVRIGTTGPIVTVTGGSVIGTFSAITNTGSLIPVVIYTPTEVILSLQAPPSSFVALLAASDRILRNIETLKQLDTRKECTETPWGVYIEPTGSFGHVKSRRNVFGNKWQTVGVRAGSDYLWTDTDSLENYQMGVVAEYNHLWAQQYEEGGIFGSNEAYGSLYSSFVPQIMPKLAINVIGGGGYSWYTFNRYPLGTSHFQAKGHSGGGQADAMLDIEYLHQRKNFDVIPTVALQYTYTHINGYQESGAGIYGLKMGHQTSQTLSTLLGLRLSSSIALDSCMTIRPEIFADWQYQYLDSTIHTHCSPVFAGAGPTSDPLNIPQFARNSLIAGADLRVDMRDTTMIQLSYDLWYNHDGLENFFLLEYKTSF